MDKFAINAKAANFKYRSASGGLPDPLPWVLLLDPIGDFHPPDPIACPAI